MPLIYDEPNKRCNILIFNSERAKTETVKIKLEKSGSRRKHPVFKFYAKKNHYICEVRYGNAAANALQRGLWTHTKNALPFFDSLTNGWVDYSHNMVLVELFSHALVSSEIGHSGALELIKNDIADLQEKYSSNEK